MKRNYTLLLIIITCIFIYSCGQKKETVENYINPVFKENLNEVYEIISKRYNVDYSDVKKKFGDPVKIEIDSVLSEVNDQVYDSTFVITYKKIIFRYYKRSSDKKYLSTGFDLNGEFKAKQFTLTASQPKEEIIALFGDPALYSQDESNEELTYALYKDENGAYYDSIIFTFIDGKFTGLRYIPYIEIYPETTDQEQQNNG